MKNPLTVESLSDRVVVTLNRPETRNAIDASVIDQIHSLLDQLEPDPKVLILCGAQAVFASGADIRELRERGRNEALMGINSGLTRRLANFQMPTIAVVDGIAFGAGAEIAYACDFRLASERCQFGNPESRLGIIAGAGGCWRLRDLVGEVVAKEMLFAGRTLDANEALQLKLVNSVHDHDEVLDAAHLLADRLRLADPLALRLAKVAMLAPSEAHPAIDNVIQAVLFESPEKFRRMTAFLDSRRAK